MTKVALPLIFGALEPRCIWSCIAAYGVGFNYFLTSCSGQFLRPSRVLGAPRHNLLQVALHRAGPAAGGRWDASRCCARTLSLAKASWSTVF